jgi:hypothetical protein
MSSGCVCYSVISLSASASYHERRDEWLVGKFDCLIKTKEREMSCMESCHSNIPRNMRFICVKVDKQDNCILKWASISDPGRCRQCSSPKKWHHCKMCVW